MNLKMRKCLIINNCILRFMGRIAGCWDTLERLSAEFAFGGWKTGKTDSWGSVGKQLIVPQAFMSCCPLPPPAVFAPLAMSGERV